MAPRLARPGVEPRWTSSQKGCGFDGLLRVEPGVVYGVARHAERGLFSDHRSAADAGHGAAVYGRGNAFSMKKSATFEYDFHYIDPEPRRCG